MKLQILSDLHLEFRTGSVWTDKGTVPEWKHLIESYTAPDAKERALILAGDICQYTGYEGIYEETLQYFAKSYKAVVLVKGNHDYYDSKNIAEVEEEILNATLTPEANVHLLDNSTVTIDGQRFIGGTLWYSPITDQKAIPGLWNWTYQSNADFKQLLKKELGPKDIVVSHHLPSMKCVDPQFKNSANQSYFVSPCDQFIEARQPKLWCFGHTHASVRQQFDKTLVIANPGGYPGERSDFDPFCYVDID